MKDGSIAIVGMAGRFPGARNIQQFWQNLRNGTESIRILSDAELRAAGVSAEELADPDYVRSAPILDDVELFDAAFFGLSPRDAAIMDPQHRHFLECAWEALENAGHTPPGFPGSVGVFAGSGMNSYLIHNLLRNRQLVTSAGFFLLRQTGNDKDVLTTRVSYQFDLHGPSVNVQTACSTSLVAVHLACQILLGQECDMAIAGGVTIECPHGQGYLYRPGEILSRDGHCRAFDAGASGTIFSSGVGIVVLRRLADALRDRDTIRAVILGSAINNDGARKVGYLAPSVDGQADVITEALGIAEVSADSISYVETHGTGTAVGDPIEVKALTQAYRASTNRKGFCAIGSLKTNVGHLDAAAGVAGLIKTTLALEHREIPASLHFQSPNPLIDFENSPFRVNQSVAGWNSTGHPRRAGVTSLGIGGTNAHVILEEAPARPQVDRKITDQLIVLSAKSQPALEQATAQLATYLRENPETILADGAFTLQAGRKPFPFRRAVVARTPAEAVSTLETFGAKQFPVAPVTSSAPRLIFLFSGQGSQHVAMAKDVYEQQKVFRDSLDTCCKYLQHHIDCDLRELIYPADAQREDSAQRLNQTCITQPVLFAIEYSLAQLWISLGLKPQAMLGHSIGEYVAACLAGVFTLQEALETTAVRGRLMQKVNPGAMLAVPLRPEQLELPNGLSLAAVNGPEQCVVSGSFEEIESFEKVLAGRGITSRRLQTSHAFHSAMMDPILDEFRQHLSRRTLRPPRIPFLSNLSGTWIQAEEAKDPEYWVKHLRGTVRFADCIARILGNGEHIFLEVGPGQTLTGLTRMQMGKGSKAVSSLPHRDDLSSANKHLLNTLGQLWVNGQSPDWPSLHRGDAVGRIPLPTYPFERQKFWVAPDEQPIQTRTATSPVAETLPAAKPAPGPSDLRFYKRSWKKSEIPSVTFSTPGCWLILMDEKGLGKQIDLQLRGAGHKVVCVSSGAEVTSSVRGNHRIISLWSGTL
jgi:acyl transferase domain-containing protein